MAKKNELAGLEATVHALARMIDGERLRISDLVSPETGVAATWRRRLRRLVEGLDHVNCSKPKQGRAQVFWWTWPAEANSTREQIWALSAARAMLGAFREGEIGRILQNVLQDHVSRFSGDAPATAGDRMFVPRTRLVRPRGLDVDAVDRVATAIAELRCVGFDYVTFGGHECEVELEPWSVVFSDEGVYVLGMCVDGPDNQLQRRRLYNIARMTNLRMLETAFVYPLPAEYDPDALFEHSFGVFLPPDDKQPATIVLRFAERWGAYLEHHRLHRSQFDQQVTEGGLEISLRLHVTYDLACWVRGLGEEVEVVQPDGLRQWVESGRGATAREEFMTE